MQSEEINLNIGEFPAASTKKFHSMVAAAIIIRTQ
jgi:hypothetical protein